MLTPQTQQHVQLATSLGKAAQASWWNEWGRDPDPLDDDDLGVLADMWLTDWHQLYTAGIPDEDYGQCNKAWYDVLMPPKRTRNQPRSRHKLSGI